MKTIDDIAVVIWSDYKACLNSLYGIEGRFSKPLNLRIRAIMLSITAEMLARGEY